MSDDRLAWLRAVREARYQSALAVVKAVTVSPKVGVTETPVTETPVTETRGGRPKSDALSPAEKQRRYRERLAAAAKTKP